MSSDNVINFVGYTVIPIPPEELLEKAKGWGMVRCMVIGIDEDGDLAFGGSFSEISEMNLLLDRAKYDILGFEGDKIQRILP